MFFQHRFNLASFNFRWCLRGERVRLREDAPQKVARVREPAELLRVSAAVRVGRLLAPRPVDHTPPLLLPGGVEALLGEAEKADGFRDSVH